MTARSITVQDLALGGLGADAGAIGALSIGATAGLTWALGTVAVSAPGIGRSPIRRAVAAELRAGSGAPDSRSPPASQGEVMRMPLPGPIGRSKA